MITAAVVTLQMLPRLFCPFEDLLVQSLRLTKDGSTLDRGPWAVVARRHWRRLDRLLSDQYRRVVPVR